MIFVRSPCAHNVLTMCSPCAYRQCGFPLLLQLLLFVFLGNNGRGAVQQDSSSAGSSALPRSNLVSTRGAVELEPPENLVRSNQPGTSGKPFSMYTYVYCFRLSITTIWFICRKWKQWPTLWPRSAHGAFGNPMLVNQQQQGPLYQGVRSSSSAIYLWIIGQYSSATQSVHLLLNTADLWSRLTDWLTVDCGSCLISVMETTEDWTS